MLVTVTGELSVEGQPDFSQIIVAAVTCRIDADANALPGIQERDISRSIYQGQRMLPLHLNYGFSQKNNVRLNFGG